METVMITATQQKNIPTWKEVIGDGLLVEYEFKFDVNFSQRKHLILRIFAMLSKCVCCYDKKKKFVPCNFTLWSVLEI